MISGQRDAPAGRSGKWEGTKVISLASLCQDLLASNARRQAIGFEDTWYEWGDISRLAEDLGAILDASGADRRAPVTVVARNRPGILAALVSLLAQNRSICMVYAFQSHAAIVANIERLEAPIVVLDQEDFVPAIGAALDRLGMAGIVVDGMKVRGLGAVRGQGHRTAPREACIEVLTSGTTGPPKHVPIAYGIVERLIAGDGLVTGSHADSSAPPFLYSLPIGNISGIYCAAASILRGRRTLLLDRFTLGAWLDYVRTYRPAIGSVPPAAISMILQADIAREEFSFIRYFTTGAAPLDPTVHRAFEERYGIPILMSYGATEFGGPVAMMTPEQHEQFGKAKFGSTGRAMPGVKLRIVDADTGVELPAGAEGRLEVVSPRIGPDWIRTSDIASVDEDGFLWHRGRADGAIMRGGFKLLPETIERALTSHPAVIAAAVTGIADERLYQVPAAAIQVDSSGPPPSVADLETHLRGLILATHMPVHWKFVQELPRTGSLKVDRAALKRLFDEESKAPEQAVTKRTKPGRGARQPPRRQSQE